MADPFSVAAGCAGLIFSVSNAIHKISKFVSEVRSARKDMDTVACQLISLQLCLESLSGDGHKRAIDLPIALRDRINQVLLNCEANIEQIVEILTKVQAGRLGRRVQWTYSERDNVEKIRSALESNKVALDIALSIGTISLLSRSMKTQNDQGHDLAVIVQQTHSTSTSTARIEHKLDELTTLHKDSTRLNMINEELIALRKQLGKLSSNSVPNHSMSVFVDQARLCVSNMIKPIAAALSEMSQTNTDSLISVEPITLSHTDAPSRFNDVPDAQPEQCLEPELCPTCAASVTNQQQRDNIQAFQVQLSAHRSEFPQDMEYAQELARFDGGTFMLSEALQSIEAMKQEHLAAIAEKDFRIRELSNERRIGLKLDPNVLRMIVEATSDQGKGPSKTQLNELKVFIRGQDAETVYQYMDILISQLMTNSSRSVRQTFKCLTVLKDLLLLGPEVCYDYMLMKIHVFKELQDFSNTNDRGLLPEFRGDAVRRAAKELCSILLDKGCFERERDIALSKQ